MFGGDVDGGNGQGEIGSENGESVHGQVSVCGISCSVLCRGHGHGLGLGRGGRLYHVLDRGGRHGLVFGLFLCRGGGHGRSWWWKMGFRVHGSIWQNPILNIFAPFGFRSNWKVIITSSI